MNSIDKVTVRRTYLNYPESPHHGRLISVVAEYDLGGQSHLWFPGVSEDITFALCSLSGFLHGLKCLNPELQVSGTRIDYTPAKPYIYEPPCDTSAFTRICGVLAYYET
jgi:hypothetical protein